MNWMDKLEKKLGKYAIPNLMWYVILLYAIGFVLDLVEPGLYYTWLALDANAILHGQVWRIVTFLIQPPDAGIIFMIFALYFYYMIGRALEFSWGVFRFNLYFFMGVLFHIIAALLVYVLFGWSLPIGTFYLNLSLFFAYAAMFPNQEFYFMMLIPIKAKYLAWIDAAYFVWTILKAFLPAYGGSYLGIVYKAQALAAFVSLLNFLVFYMSSKNMRRYAPKEMYRRTKYKSEVQKARQSTMYKDGARHRCAVCGRTELDDPNLEFRYCSKCNGNYEYCQDHLFTHEHIR